MYNMSRSLVHTLEATAGYSVFEWTSRLQVPYNVSPRPDGFVEGFDYVDQ